MKRLDGRRPDELRKVKVVKNYTKHAVGSCLIEFGETRVLCSVMVEEGVPNFLKNTGKGWLTAEYGMLPSSCNERVKRNANSGRTYEIQRLIGRSLRAAVDLDRLGERTLKVDCDVLQADGGTRTASITGAFIALVLALQRMKKEEKIQEIPLKDYVAAVSVGICEGVKLLDLKYEEDSTADMDMNVVVVGKGDLIEIQGTAEKVPFSKSQMDALLKLADKGVRQLFAIQKKAIGDIK